MNMKKLVTIKKFFWIFYWLSQVTPFPSTHVHKKTINQLVISLFFQKYLKGYLVGNLLEFFDNILSKFQCGFRKGYGTQHCLLLMLEIWKGATDNNKASGAILTVLKKAFDCLCHNLLIATLHAYGLDIDSLNIQHYLSNRMQRTKVDSFYSSWEAVLCRVPQGYILGLLLFNIFMCDMF